MQRGAVLMHSRAGLVQPVSPETRKQARGQRDVPAALSRAVAGRRVLESQQSVDYVGHQAGDRPQPPPQLQLRRATPQEIAAKRQMQKELLQGQKSEMGGAGGVGRARVGPQRSALGPASRHQMEAGRPPQGHEAPGPLTLALTSPPNLHSGYFSPVAPKHFSSKSSEPPDKAQPSAGSPQSLRRAHLASPVRVSSGPTAFPPRNLHLSAPRIHASAAPVAARRLAEDNTSPRFFSDAEKTPYPAGGKQEGGWKASSRHPGVPPVTNTARRAVAQGETAVASERRKAIPKERGDEKLLRNLNLKVAETKSGRMPDRGKFPTNTATELNKTANDVTSGRGRGNFSEMVHHRNPYTTGEREVGPIYQMERKALFGRGGMLVPPHRDSQEVGLEMFGAKAAQFQGRSIVGAQQQQMQAMPPSVKVPMTPPKLSLIRSPVDTSRMASEKKPPTTVAKKTAESPPKSPTPVLASPATSPTSSPRPSMMTTPNAPSKNIISGIIAKGSPGTSPVRPPKSQSPRNSPARTYVVTTENSPTAIPVPTRKNPARSPQTTATANVSTKSHIDSSMPQTTTSTTTGKDKKGRYQNPKSRLSAGGDPHTAKPGIYTVGAEDVADPLTAAPAAQNKTLMEAYDPHHQVNELSGLNQERQLSKTSPRVRKLTRISKSYLLPVKNALTPRSAVSQYPQEEEQGKNDNSVSKQVTPRMSSVGDGNKKLLPPGKNRKGAAAGTIHTEGSREAARGRPAAARQRRAHKAGRPAGSLDVAAALPDTSGNFTSAVHQWLRQSHYKVISPQQYRQHETIEEETVKQPGVKETAPRDERLQKPTAPDVEKEKAAPRPQKAARRGRVAPPRKQKDAAVVPKMEKEKQPSSEASKRKPGTKRGAPKVRSARRKKEKEKEARTAPAARPAPAPAAPATPTAKARPRLLRPRRGPAGDSGDLGSSSSEVSSYLSASDEGMNEQAAMC